MRAVQKNRSANTTSDRFFTFSLVAVIFTFAALAVTSIANSAASDDDDKPKKGAKESHYQAGMSLTKKGDYKKAHQAFLLADKAKAGNPDTLNMLGYTARKIGNYDAALTYYKKALKLRPDFPQAREYLAQAFVELAMKEVKLLKSYGPEGNKLANQVLTTMKAHANGVSSPRPFSSY